MFKILIVDDEPLALAHLRYLLASQGIQHIFEASNAAAALQLAEEQRPDVLMLDIQMPGLDGLQLAGALQHMTPPPLLIFTTGYSEYAVDAFERGAIDYLLKPISPERLARTLVRVRERLTDERLRRQAQQNITALAEETKVLSRLPVRADYAVRLIRVDDILCATAREKHVFVRTIGTEYRTYYTLVQLEKLLPPEHFLRIHDSAIVNLDCIDELLFLGNHSYELRLADGLCLPVGRSRYAEVLQKLGLKSPRPS